MRRISGWMTIVAGCAVLMGLTACKPSEAVRQGAVLGNGSKAGNADLDPATLGTVQGIVHFAGKPPVRLKIDMSQDPNCVQPGEDNYAEQYVVHEGKLANVYVYVKSGPPAALTVTPEGPQHVVMDQVGCRYTPHVVAVMRGGTVEFRNSDDTMHNIHTIPAGDEKQINITQAPKGSPQMVQFKQAEIMLPVRCDLHPWMNGFVNVSDTPFFAVTDADGHFKIEGLPPGTYVLAAVHEKMGEQTMTVTVEPHGTATADFTFAMKQTS